MKTMEATRQGHEARGGGCRIHTRCRGENKSTYYSPAAQIRNSVYNQFSI
jgi:hypothetical protein